MHRIKVLIVEDEALIAEEIHDRLQRLGHEVVGVADSAERAIAMARQESPGLILMDVRLKGEEDGIDAATVIGERMDVPVIFTTAHSDADTIGRAMLTRPFGYVVKPVSEADMVAAIETALLRHAAEKRLQGAEAQARAIVDHSSDCILQMLPDGKLLSANPSARAMLGYTPSQICRLGLTDLVREGDKETVTKAIRSAAESASVLHIHATLQAKDGRELPAAGVLGRRLVGDKVDRVWAMFHETGASSLERGAASRSLNAVDEVGDVRKYRITAE